MKNKCVIGLFFFFYIGYCEQLFSDTDFQYWNSEGIEFKIKDKIKITITEELRFQENASSLYHHFTEAGITIPIKKYFDFSLQYRHIYEKKGDNWNLENRPHINGTIKIKWHKLTIADRNRLEYRIHENTDNTWRYRNRLSVELPCQWTSLQIQPYGAEEIFFDFTEKKINRNRIYLGFKMKLLKFLKGEIYYLIQSSKKTEWIDFHILGTKIKLIF